MESEWPRQFFLTSLLKSIKALLYDLHVVRRRKTAPGGFIRLRLEPDPAASAALGHLVDAYAALMLAHEALVDLRARGKRVRKRSGRGYFL